MSDALFLAGLGPPLAKLDPSQVGLDVFSKMQRSHAHEFAILNSAAMHILDFWVRAIPHHSGAAILNSGVQWALNVRPTWKKRNHAHGFDFLENLKIWSHGLSLTFCVPARLNRYPRITDAGGYCDVTM